MKIVIIVLSHNCVQLYMIVVIIIKIVIKIIITFVIMKNHSVKLSNYSVITKFYYSIYYI